MKIPETFANKGCILNPENIASWVKEEIDAFGVEKAKQIFSERADRVKALIPHWIRYVSASFEPFYWQAEKMWSDAAK